MSPSTDDMPQLVCKDFQPKSNYPETMHMIFQTWDTFCKLYSLDSKNAYSSNLHNWQLHEIHHKIKDDLLLLPKYHQYLLRKSYTLQSIFMDQLHYTINDKEQRMMHGPIFCWSMNFYSLALVLGKKALIAHDTLYCNKSFEKLLPQIYK